MWKSTIMECSLSFSMWCGWFRARLRAAQGPVAGGEVGAERLLVARCGRLQEQQSPYPAFRTVGPSGRVNGAGDRLVHVRGDLVDQAEPHGLVGRQLGREVDQPPGPRDPDLLGEAVYSHAGPELAGREWHAEPEVRGTDPVVGGQQHFEGGTAAAALDHRDGDRVEPFDAP